MGHYEGGVGNEIAGWVSGKAQARAFPPTTPLRCPHGCQEAVDIAFGRSERGLQLGCLARLHRERASQASQQIAASAHQQNVGMEQIAVAMRDIHQATEQFVAGARQSELAAKDLNESAQGLKATIGFYKT